MLPRILRGARREAPVGGDGSGSAAGAGPPAGGGRLPRLADALAAAVLALVVLAAYANSLGGELVYDDRRQIVDNHLIREPGSLGRALVSDVWAFKGESVEPWSNYWRPTFVLFLALGYRLFGVGSAVGWHLAVVALHALVTVLAFRLVRRLGGAPPVAWAVALLFAVHPVHVESVAWVSGVPDPLMAAALLGALTALAPPGGGAPSAGRRLAALALFAAALGAKEAAVTFPLLVALLFLLPEGGTGGLRPRLRRAFVEALPFVAVAALWLAARHAVLGRLEIDVPWRLGAGELLLQVPRLLAFYLGQALAPVRLGPSYPLRAIGPGELDAAGFWLPLALVAAVAAGWVWLARRDRLAALGGGLFLLPLAPAFNLNAFLPEQIVHDRYLYLPVLGVAMAAVAGLEFRYQTWIYANSSFDYRLPHILRPYWMK